MPNHPSYLEELFRVGGLTALAKKAAAVLEHPYFRDVDFIAGRGISGMVPAAAIAAHLNKSPLLIRKEASHDDTMVLYGAERDISQYVIVDDLYASGNTLQTIINAVNGVVARPPLAIFLYGDHNSGANWVAADYTSIPVIYIGPSRGPDLSSIPVAGQTPRGRDAAVPSAPLPRSSSPAGGAQPSPSSLGLRDYEFVRPSDSGPRVDSLASSVKLRPYDFGPILRRWDWPTPSFLLDAPGVPRGSAPWTLSSPNPPRDCLTPPERERVESFCRIAGVQIDSRGPATEESERVSELIGSTRFQWSDGSAR